MAKFVAQFDNTSIGFVPTIDGSAIYPIQNSGVIATTGAFDVTTLNIVNNSALTVTLANITGQIYRIELEDPTNAGLTGNYPQVFYIILSSTGQPYSVSFQYEEDTPPADLTICTECRQSNQQACGETYFIEAGLTSGDTYYAAITDRNNDVYTQAIMADANGNLTIDALAPEFPTGFWLAESGNKSITVYEDEEMTIVSELTVGANVYTCMILSLQYIYVTTTSLTPDFSFYVSDTLEYYVDQSSNSYISS
jgi:hypothetical protein